MDTGRESHARHVCATLQDHATNETANTKTAHPWDNLMTATILRNLEGFLARAVKSYR